MTLTLTPFDALILGLATWRIAYLAAKEAAPFGIMTRIRARTTLGGLLTCLYCMSVWAAALMLLLWHTPLQFLVWVAAISGAALMLASWTGANHTP